MVAAVVGFAAAGSVFAYSCDTYDYAEVSEGSNKEVRLAIPAEVTTVKGILVVANATGNDSRTWYTGGSAYEVFLHLHGFAFIGTARFNSHVQSLTVMQHALAQIALNSGHPELVNVPYVTTGVSAGGGFASTLVTQSPERVIAAVIDCARLNLTVFTANSIPVPATVIRTPVLDLPVDAGGPYLTPNLNAYRPAGGLYAWTVTWGHGDEYAGQEVIAMPYLEAALKLRYPSTGDVRVAPLKLKAIDPMSGWIADDTTWKSGLTKICPTRMYKGDIGQSSWLINQDIAYIYRAYATYNPPLKITSPAQNSIYAPVQAAGSSSTVVVDATKFADWKKLEFYDGATLLGTITSGATQFTAKNLTPGFHTFSVLGTDSSGNVRTSNPAMVAVHQ
jgi:hypothetical protein